LGQRFTGTILFLIPLLWAPASPSFWTYRMLCKLGDYLHRDGFCITKINISLLNTDMAGQFTLQINSALLIGITAWFPVFALGALAVY
jgi:sec-independent protein translocase protein TatC